MRAAVLRNFGDELVLEHRPMPEPKDDEILVRVLGAGVCHTDLHIIAGRMPGVVLPRVLGHEISGYAEGIGQVLIYASWGCGKCQYCQAGTEQLCSNVAEPGWVRDGGYAEYVLVPSRQYLIPLEGLDPVRAAPLADAGLTPYRAVRRIQRFLDRNSMTMVIGVGGLGQFAIQYLKLLTNCRVVAVDRNETKLRRAQELGADQVIMADGPWPVVRAVLDFVGSDGTLSRGAQSLERGGVLMVVGEAGGSVPFGIQQTLHEAWFTTTIWGSRKDLGSVVDLARGNQIEWIVEPITLTQVNDALKKLSSGLVAGRLVLTP